MMLGEEESDDDQTNARIHQNQPYDESLEVPDAEEVVSTYSPTPRVHQAQQQELGKSHGSTPPDSRLSEEDEEEEDDEEEESDEFENEKGNEVTPQAMQRPQPIAGKLQKAPPKGQPPQQQQFNSEEEESGSETTDEDDDDDDDDDDEHVTLEGAYDPADYANLTVTPEIKELFQYIARYTPQSIELEHKLRPFIPDYIPAVGDIDAFIKIGRPDNKPDTLGLTVLDEPCAKQSDPTVLDLQLRAISKQTTDKKLIVKSLQDAEKNPKQIDNWMENIRELHRSKPPPNVHYSKNMPDVESLMQEWPPEFEELLKEVGLPTAELDCDLGEYVDLVCSVLDIPIYKNTAHHNERTQALHVLFTLYSVFKNSQHFSTLNEGHTQENAGKGMLGDTGEVQEADRFVL